MGWMGDGVVGHTGSPLEMMMLFVTSNIRYVLSRI